MNAEFKRGMLRAAEIADMFADENMRMADDTINLDPIICQERHGPITTAQQLVKARKVSQRLITEGSYYSSRSHAAKDIAEFIRKETR